MQFTDTSTGGATSWTWTFGTGAVSTQRHPVYTYQQPGTYTVSLTARNAGGASVTSRSVVVTSPLPAKVVPVIANLPGIPPSTWRSDMALANPSDQPLPLELKLTVSPSAVYTRVLTLQPRHSALFENVVSSLFQLSQGRGSLTVQPPPAGPYPVLTSRTYSAEPTGNLGQSVPAVLPSPAGTYYLTGLRQDDAYRSNIAVTAGAAQVTATFALARGIDGETVAGVSKSIPAGTQTQWTLPHLFPDQAQDGIPMTVAVALSHPGVPYASVVDQNSRDAITLLAQTPATEWLIPVAAHNPGKDGTFWQSDLSLANPGAQGAQVSLSFLPENTDNSSGGIASPSFFLPAGATVTIEDVVRRVFTITNGKGSLRIAANRPVVVTSRVFTTAGGGTMGHAVPAIPPTAFSPSPRTLPGLRETNAYRTNIGLMSGSAGATVNLTLRGPAGNVITTRGFFVPPRSMRQLTFQQAFGAVAVPDPVGSVTVTATAPIATYIVTVDGSSQDPVFALIAP